MVSWCRTRLTKEVRELRVFLADRHQDEVDEARPLKRAKHHEDMMDLLPATSNDTPSQVIQYITPAPAASYEIPVPVVEYTAPAPAVSYTALVLGVEYASTLSTTITTITAASKQSACSEIRPQREHRHIF